MKSTQCTQEIPDNLYSVRLERQVLGGLIKYPDIFFEVNIYLDKNDFFSRLYSLAYIMLAQYLRTTKTSEFDVALLAEKIESHKHAVDDQIGDVEDFLREISLTQINRNAIPTLCQQLKEFTIRRDYYRTGSEIQEEMISNVGKGADDAITTVDKLLYNQVSRYTLSHEPQNISEGMLDLIEERGNNPDDNTGLPTTLKEFDTLYGGLRSGHIHAIVSRPGEGKSTFLANVALKMCRENNVKVLFLDTEMDTEEVKFRIAASMTGVDAWYLETGNWRKNPNMVKTIRESEKLKSEFGFFHEHVSNRTIDEICSIIRRFKYTEVGRNEKCLIVYDYIKLTGEKVSQNWAEYQAIGEKINKLKETAKEIDAPMLTAMQQNRQGENRNRKSSDIVDDASVIALSDRLQWFAAFVAIFRRKTMEEVVLDGEDFGSHKLIPIKTRFQGQASFGHRDFLERTMPDGTQKNVRNYLNFDVQNFEITERGSLRHVIERTLQSYEPEDSSNDDGQTGLEYNSSF